MYFRFSINYLWRLRYLNPVIHIRLLVGYAYNHTQDWTGDTRGQDRRVCCWNCQCQWPLIQCLYILLIQTSVHIPTVRFKLPENMTTFSKVWMSWNMFNSQADWTEMYFLVYVLFRVSKRLFVICIPRHSRSVLDFIVLPLLGVVIFGCPRVSKLTCYRSMGLTCKTCFSPYNRTGCLYPTVQVKIKLFLRAAIQRGPKMDCQFNETFRYQCRWDIRLGLRGGGGGARIMTLG